MGKTEIVYGLHTVKAFIEKRLEYINNAFVVDFHQDRELHDIVNELKRHKISVEKISKERLDKLSNKAVHQGIILEVTVNNDNCLEDLLEQLENSNNPLRVLILDGLQDPHNLGACLRTADAFGVSAVIIPRNKSVSVTPVVRKVACGATETIPIIKVVNIATTIKRLQQARMWVVGTAADSKETLKEVELNQHIALVMGSEGSGMRRLTRENCDQLVKIPMSGYVSSLNVSVSTGIALYHLCVLA